MARDDEDISSEDYTQTQSQIILLGKLVRDLPLVAFLNKIQRCESVAPLFNPSLYMRGTKKLDLIKQMAEGLLEFQRSIPAIEDFIEADQHQTAVEKMQGVFTGDIDE
jgi:hypothetical protein